MVSGLDNPASVPSVIECIEDSKTTYVAAVVFKEKGPQEGPDEKGIFASVAAPNVVFSRVVIFREFG